MTRLTWVTRQTRQIFPPDRLREGWSENCQTCEIDNLQFRVSQTDYHQGKRCYRIWKSFKSKWATCEQLSKNRPEAKNRNLCTLYISLSMHLYWSCCFSTMSKWYCSVLNNKLREGFRKKQKKVWSFAKPEGRGVWLLEPFPKQGNLPWLCNIANSTWSSPTETC